VDLPPGKTTLGCMCVYKIKTWLDGSIERYKSKICGKGIEYDVDYKETFAPIARLTSVHSLLVIAIVRRSFIWRLRMCFSKEILPPARKCAINSNCFACHFSYNLIKLFIH
jgi:hypothetical protein